MVKLPFWPLLLRKNGSGREPGDHTVLPPSGCNTCHEKTIEEGGGLSFVFVELPPPKLRSFWIWYCQELEALRVICFIVSSHISHINCTISIGVMLNRYTSSGSRNFGEGGPTNMKYKPPRMVAIFFWPIFTGRGGGHGPLAPPPWIRYCTQINNWQIQHELHGSFICEITIHSTIK